MSIFKYGCTKGPIPLSFITGQVPSVIRIFFTEVNQVPYQEPPIIMSLMISSPMAISLPVQPPTLSFQKIQLCCQGLPLMEWYIDYTSMCHWKSQSPVKTPTHFVIQMALQQSRLRVGSNHTPTCGAMELLPQPSTTWMPEPTALPSPMISVQLNQEV